MTSLIRRIEKEIIQMNLFTKQKQIHRLRKQSYSCQWGRTQGRDSEFGTDIYTLLYLKCITNKDLLHSTANSTQYSVITNMRKESEKE